MVSVSWLAPDWNTLCFSHVSFQCFYTNTRKTKYIFLSLPTHTYTHLNKNSKLHTQCRSLTNYCQQAKSVCTHLFTCCLWFLSCYNGCMAGGVVATKVIWSKKLKIFTVALQKRFVEPCSRYGFFNLAIYIVVLSLLGC